MIAQKNKKIARPFSMEYAEAKSKILNAVNEANRINGVPCYLLESIISDILSQVRECAKKEHNEAKLLYERQLAKTAAEADKMTEKSEVNNV